MAKVYKNTTKIQFEELPKTVQNEHNKLLNVYEYYKLNYDGYLPFNTIYVCLNKKEKYNKIKKDISIYLFYVYEDIVEEVPIVPHTTSMSGAYITDHDYTNNRIRINAVQQVNKWINLHYIPDDCIEERLYCGHYSD